MSSHDTAHILDLDADSLKKALDTLEEPGFRATQIMDWIFKKQVLDFNQMLNLPKTLRHKLANSFRLATARPIDKAVAKDGTVKLLLELDDSETVECVVIPTSANRTAVCLSTQVGCPVRCRFCASGADGLVRDLRAGEIIEQLLWCCQEIDGRPDNIVLMGTGEPLMNLDNVLPALDTFADPQRFGIARRRITVSTSGWTRGINRLATEGGQCNLAFSIHGPNDQIRKKLIPENALRPLEEILDACDHHRNTTGRMTTFEYTLVNGVNDSPTQAAALAEIAKKHRAKINLIPYNETIVGNFTPPPASTIRTFLGILRNEGARATLRVERGGDINAACGQLRHRNIPKQPRRKKKWGLSHY